MSSYIVRRMKQNEVQIAIDWARDEGWNPGLEDADCFFQADPNGFFIGLLNNEPIAVGSAVVYDNQYAFCGLYIVKKGFRHQGYGIKLTEERLKYTGKRVTGIDGVLENVSIYARLGYVSSHKQIRFELTKIPAFATSKNVQDARTIPFASLSDFDRDHFPASREAFLNHWIDQKNGYSLGFVEGQKLRGYGVIRKCSQGCKIGPLFASSKEIAKILFESLASKMEKGPLYLDIPETNRDAQVLVNEYNMVSKFTVMRMYRNGFPEIKQRNGIFGVTSFELG